MIAKCSPAVTQTLHASVIWVLPSVTSAAVLTRIKLCLHAGQVHVQIMEGAARGHVQCHTSATFPMFNDQYQLLHTNVTFYFSDVFHVVSIMHACNTQCHNTVLIWGLGTRLKPYPEALNMHAIAICACICMQEL